MNERFFWYENPNGGKDLRIYFDDIEYIAEELYNDNRNAEEMDDDSFYKFVEVYLEKIT